MYQRPAVCLLIALVVGLMSGCGDDNPVSVAPYEHSEILVYDFTVDGTPVIGAGTFVGEITYDPSKADDVRITVTKWANREADLAGLLVESGSEGDAIQLTASNPDHLQEVAVDIAITGPPSADLDMAAGVGSIACTGRPGPRWVLDVGVGAIELAVPADAALSVDLSVGVGQIEVGFSVDGEVSDRRIVGVIGSGDDGEIVANTGVGSITLQSR
jgi:hypothetical protein